MTLMFTLQNYPDVVNKLFEIRLHIIIITLFACLPESVGMELFQVLNIRNKLTISTNKSLR